MPISKIHKLCFIHIPKVAGTTIEKALDMHHEDLFYRYGKYKKYEVCPQHLTHQELSLEIPNLSEYQLFTVVRNPFDRIVSEYNFYHETWWAKEYYNLNFDDFVRICLSIDKAKRKFCFDGHLEPQVDYIRGDLPVKIFKYENLEECFYWLREITGENLNFGHERKAERKNYKDYYDNVETIKIVEDFYRDDLDYLDYNF